MGLEFCTLGTQDPKNMEVCGCVAEAQNNGHISPGETKSPANMGFWEYETQTLSSLKIGSCVHTSVILCEDAGAQKPFALTGGRIYEHTINSVHHFYGTLWNDCTTAHSFNTTH